MTQRRPFHKKTFCIPTPDSLAQAALSYLSRYAASEASLRRALENRLRRAAMQNETFAHDRAAQDSLRAAIDALVQKYKDAGVVNDQAFAEMKVRALRRAGGSSRKIAQRLEQKGLPKTIIHDALTNQDEGACEEQEERAALAFAKRRRLGPFREKPGKASPEQLRLQTQKDVAALLRAGFSFDMVQRVMKNAST